MLLIAILRKETSAYDLAMAVWHLERHSFQHARKYFGHLATLLKSRSGWRLAVGKMSAS